MNKDKVLEILKKNIFSVVCGVLVIAALVVAFIPVGGMFEKLKGDADQHASEYGTIQGLLTKQRKLPLTDPSKSTQDDLGRFPTQKVIDAGKAATAAVHDQSQKLVDTVVGLDAKLHQPLVGDALPSPLSDSPRFRFGELYKAVFDTEKSVETDPLLKSNKAPNLRNDILKGGTPPSDAEITAKKASMWDNDFKYRIVYTNGQAMNEPDITAQFGRAAALLPEQMRVERATKFKMYVAPDALTMNPNVIGKDAPALVDIFNAQTTLWIQQDVASALAEIDKDSANVQQSPVKHLIKLTVPGTFAPANAPAPGTVPPVPAEGGDLIPIVKNYAQGFTGRTSNAMFDVVNFTLVINVDASQVPVILSMLAKNRLMDVLTVDQASIDTSAERLKGFIYGPMPVVQLSLKCEAMFMRKNTIPLMPKAIRDALNIAPPAPATPVPAPAQ